MRTIKSIVFADARDQVPAALSHHLDEAGYRLTYMTDGSDVLWRCESNPPDLLILDTRLRDMDGLDVCRYLRDCSFCAEMPILVLTEADDKLTRHYARQMTQFVGADYFLAKPYDPIILLQVIDDILRGNRRRRARRDSRFPTRVVWPTNCALAGARD